MHKISPYFTKNYNICHILSHLPPGFIKNSPMRFNGDIKWINYSLWKRLSLGGKKKSASMADDELSADLSLQETGQMPNTVFSRRLMLCTGIIPHLVWKDKDL